MNIANLIGVIASLAWIAFLGVAALVLFRVSKKTPMKGGGSLLLITLVVSIILSTVSAGLVFINPQERGIVISATSPKGYRDVILQPGLRWIIPFAESVVRYPISKQTYTMSIAPSEGQYTGDDSIEARTADGQKVLVDASVIYSVNPEDVIDVHITWQDRYSSDLVRPVARGVIRDAVSQFGIEEVYSSKRAELVELMTESMRIKLLENGLLLSDFVLRNISFSEEYAASVEQKQIAEQQAQQAKFVVEQKKQEAEQARQIAQGRADAAVIEAQGRADGRLIEAEAEAQALIRINEAIMDKPELLTYQYITKLSPNVEVMLLPNDTPFLFPLPEMQPTPVPELQTQP